MIKVLYDDERGVKEYENIDKMIFENLLEHKLDFIKVANAYVQTLEIEKENKELHEKIDKAKSYVLEFEEELLPYSPGWIRDLLNILGDSNE